MRTFMLIIAIALIMPRLTFAILADNEIKEILIQKSVRNYLSNIGNCPCPYNTDKGGRSCGKRSAWSKAGGYSPLCYPSDITSDMIFNYKQDKR